MVGGASTCRHISPQKWGTDVGLLRRRYRPIDQIPRQRWSSEGIRHLVGSGNPVWRSRTESFHTIDTVSLCAMGYICLSSGICRVGTIDITDVLGFIGAQAYTWK